MVSGSGGGGDCPPSHSGGQCSGRSQLSDRVQHSLKRSLESEEMPGLISQFVHFVSAKKHAPVVSSAFSAPAALGAPPPDDSFVSPKPFGPTQGVEGSASSAPISLPDFGINRRLAEFPSLAVDRDRKERSLRSLSRVPDESRAFSFNSSGMLNQTGQVDRHTLPSSLPLPSRSSVPGSRFLVCSLLLLPRILAVQFRPLCPFLLFLFRRFFDVEDPEWDDPYFSPRKSRSRVTLFWRCDGS